MMIAATRRTMTLRARLLAVVLAIVALTLGARPAPAAYINAVTGFSIVSRLTGASSLNQTNLVGIGGTDLGHMVNHQGKTYFLFGDTFSGDTPAIGGDWRHNAMAWSTDTQPANGILFDDWLRTGATAREVIHSGISGSITEIPTGAVSIGDRIYAWYMAVNFWGPPGQWTINHAGLANWSVGDQQFTVVPGFRFPSNSNFAMVAANFRPPAEGGNDNHLYVWGTPPGRFGGVKLARVLPDQVANMSAYEYFDSLADGQPVWTTSEFGGASIVPAPVGEMSVMYNQAAGQWTMMYFNEVQAAIELRQAPHPWGPWSSPFTVTTSVQTPGGMYAPYMNPLYVENDGQTIYFTMSLFAPYDVYLAKATLRIVPEPSSIALAAAGGMAVLVHALRRRNRFACRQFRGL
jgi:D-arabinan endo alpha-(1,5)-arabinofuranosidase